MKNPSGRTSISNDATIIPALTRPDRCSLSAMTKIRAKSVSVKTVELSRKNDGCKKSSGIAISARSNLICLASRKVCHAVARLMMTVKNLAAE